MPPIAVIMGAFVSAASWTAPGRPLQRFVSSAFLAVCVADAV
jgi:hypothetical protein